jgi:putative ABC transport system permease protein
MDVLRGKISKSIGANAFRRILVVGQFTISVILISSTLIIGKQLNYIRSKELGYDKSYVFSFHVPDINSHYDAMKAQLLREPGVISVTRSSDNIISLSNQTGNTSWDGKGPNQTFMVYPVAIDKDFIPFFKLQLVEGSNFSGAVTDSVHVILNETAVREAGIQDPIGKRFKLHEQHATIIGVVKDFHFASLKNKIEPAVFYYDPAFSREVHVRTRARDAAKAVAAARKVWEKDFAAYPFSYHFMDETFENMYKADQRTGTLFNVFALVAIVISCLGLFGLAAYTAQVRTREIGVRKVLGASVGQLVQLLARDFIRLVLLAILISVPPSWYLMNKWLEDFAYKIGIPWTVFFLSAMLAIGIALLTISFQSVKAALVNPVKNLRTE